MTKPRKKIPNKDKSLKNYLIENAPELIKFWDKSNQDEISEIFPYVDRKYIWKCQSCDDGVFKARPKDVFRKEKTKRQKHCKECSSKERSKKYLKSVIERDGSLLDHMPKIVDEWDYDLNKKNPEEYSRSSHDEVYFKCLFGHESYPATIYNKFYKQTKCPNCKIQTSEAEVRVYCELKKYFNKTVWRNKVRNKEVDVLVPELNLAIEIDGYPWHVEKLKQDNKKTKILEDQGFTVVRIRDNLLPKINGNIVKSDLANFKHNEFLKLIFLLKKIYKSEIPRELVDSKSFLSEKEFKELYSQLPKPLYEECLEFTHPKVKEIWNYKKNHPLTPDMFKRGSRKSVWWKCDLNHSWENQINRVFRNNEYDKKGNITRKASVQNCPKCPKKKYYPSGNEFKYRGQTFVSFAEACRHFSISRTNIYHVAKSKSITKEKALITLIERKNL